MHICVALRETRAKIFVIDRRYLCIYKCVREYTHTYIYIYIYIYIHIYIYAYAYMCSTPRDACDNLCSMSAVLVI